MKSKVIILLTIILTVILHTTSSSELVYEPINPSFGGNSYNGTWLFNQAQAQNAHGDKKKTSSGSSYSRDPFDQFQESLNRLLLSRLSSNLMDAIYQDGEVKPGTYEIGNYSVNITEEGNTIRITLDDLATGNHTSIEIPAY